MLIPDKINFSIESCTVSYKENLQDVIFALGEQNIILEDNRTTPKNYLNFNFRLSILDDISKIEQTGLWFNLPNVTINNFSLTNFLKFKVFVCLNKNDEYNAQNYFTNEAFFDNRKIFDITLDQFKKSEISQFCVNCKGNYIFKTMRSCC